MITTCQNKWNFKWRSSENFRKPEFNFLTVDYVFQRFGTVNTYQKYRSNQREYSENTNNCTVQILKFTVTPSLSTLMKKTIYFLCFSVIQFFSLFSIAQNSVAQDYPTEFAQRSTYERLIESKKEYQKALAIGDSVAIAELCYRLAKRYQDLNDAKNTLFYFLQALKIRKSIGTSDDVGKIYQRMGEWYFHRAEYTTSEKYFRQAIHRFGKTIPYKHRIVECYRVLGDIYQKKAALSAAKSIPPSRPNYDSALYYYNYASDLGSKSNLPIEVARASSQISVLLLTNSENKQSIEYAKKAFELFQNEKDFSFSIFSAATIAHNYMFLGKMEESKKWLDKAESIATLSKSPIQDRIGYMNLFREYYVRKGEWQNAYFYQEQTYLSSIQNEEINQKSIAEGVKLLSESEHREAELQSQKNELELALSRENQLQQTWLSIFIALLFITSGIAGIIYYRLFMRYKVISQKNEELLKEQSHRIKNNLQSVSDLTLQLYELSDPHAVQALEESLARINAMSLIHRRLYQRGQSETIELMTFIPDLVADVLRSYQLSLVPVVYNLDNLSLPADKAITLALLLNELTTNACKYALKDNSDPLLEITCQLSGQDITIIFRDNGPGFTASASPDTFGLKLIPILVKKLKGKSHFNYNNGMNFHLSFTMTGKNIDKKELTIF